MRTPTALLAPSASTLSHRPQLSGRTDRSPTLRPTDHTTAAPSACAPIRMPLPALGARHRLLLLLYLLLLLLYALRDEASSTAGDESSCPPRLHACAPRNSGRPLDGGLHAVAQNGCCRRTMKTTDRAAAVTLPRPPLLLPRCCVLSRCCCCGALLHESLLSLWASCWTANVGCVSLALLLTLECVLLWLLLCAGVRRPSVAALRALAA